MCVCECVCVCVCDCVGMCLCVCVCVCVSLGLRSGSPVVARVELHNFRYSCPVLGYQGYFYNELVLAHLPAALSLPM